MRCSSPPASSNSGHAKHEMWFFWKQLCFQTQGPHNQKIMLQGVTHCSAASLMSPRLLIQRRCRKRAETCRKLLRHLPCING